MLGRILGIVFFVLILQGFLTYYQIKDYKKNADELIQNGRIGFGNARRRFSSGAIVILAADENEIVVAGRILTGISVFAKFVNFPNYEGNKLSTIIGDMSKQLDSLTGLEHAKASATLSAAQMLYNQFRAERGEEAESAMGLAGEVVDAQITEAHLENSNQGEARDVFKEFEDFEEFKEPEVIDVEEIKEKN